jgi:chromosome segregation ATPase
VNIARPLALTAAGILSVTALAGCSSDSGSDATTEELEVRVTALEEQVRGLESIIGRVIIADPAASMQQLSDEVATLEQEFADAQAAAGEASDEVAAEVDALQKSLNKAKKSVTSAQEAADETRDQLIVDAEALVADFQLQLEELKEKILEAVGSAAPSPEASAE